VRHAHHDLVRSRLRRELDRLVEHRDERVEALERELLLPEERLPQVRLESLCLRQPRQERALLVRRQRRAVAAGLDRLPQPDALVVVRDVLDLVREVAAVGRLELRERLRQRGRRDVEPQHRCGDARLELGRQRRLEAERVEGGIADRLRAEGVEPRGEVAVHPVRLDERHRGRDAAEEKVVGTRGRCDRRCRGSVRGRLRRCGEGGAVPAAVAAWLVEQAREPGPARDELAGAALEERPPLGRNRLRVLEVLLEQELTEPGVQPVDVARHSAHCSDSEARVSNARSSRRPPLARARPGRTTSGIPRAA
jgi:hypothetical protein